jgi:hypothetical protein
MKLGLTEGTASHFCGKNFVSAMSHMGQTEKASHRAILDRFTTESGHTSHRADWQLRANRVHHCDAAISHPASCQLLDNLISDG